MAGWRGARDGAMATALARPDGERAANAVGPRCAAVERRLRPALRLYRLARLADAWGTAGAAAGVHPHLRQRAGGMGREPSHPAHPETRGTAAASQHLQMGHAVHHADRLLVDGERLYHWLFSGRHVPDLPAERGGPQPCFRHVAGYAAELDVFFCPASSGAGVADRVGRRWALILPAICGIIVTPFYLLTHNYAMIVFFFALQGCFAGGGMYAQNPTYLAERFPTEVRATAGGFCYHQGAIFGGLTAPILTFFAVNMHLGFAIPMLIGTIAGCASFIVALLFSPETRGKELVPDVVLA